MGKGGERKGEREGGRESGEVKGRGRGTGDGGDRCLATCCQCEQPCTDTVH